MSSNSRMTLINRLRRGAAVRQRFVDSHLARGIAHQIRAMRERVGWSQQQLADSIGSNQNSVYRLESPDYGRATLTTLKKVAAAMDVALIVRFVPYSELVDWVSGTPRVVSGLSYAALDVPSFDDENNADFWPIADEVVEAEGTNEVDCPQDEYVLGPLDDVGVPIELIADAANTTVEIGVDY